MHLKSFKQQTVRLKALNFSTSFQAGELLLSEISRKFSLNEISTTLAKYHLPVLETFVDKNKWFGLLLCQANHDY